MHKLTECARVAELVNALDLGSSGVFLKSSSLFSRTTKNYRPMAPYRSILEAKKEPTMAYTIENPSQTSCKIHFSLTDKEVNSVINSTLKKYASEVKIDGFRPGKVPHSIIEKRYGEDLYSQAKEELVNTNLRTALDNEKIRPVNSINFENEDEMPALKKGEGFSFVVVFEVMPKIDLPIDFSSYSVTYDEISVSDEEVDKNIEFFLQYYSKLEEVTEDRYPEAGDVLLVDLEGSLDGSPVEGMNTKNFMMQLSDNNKNKELEDLARSVKKGEEGTGTMVCPDDYPHEEFRGKTIDIKMNVHNIQKQIIPALNDDFIKQIGLESVEQFKDIMRKKVETDKQNNAKMIAQKEIIAKIMEDYDYPLPESMVKAALNNYMMQARYELGKQNVNPEQMVQALADMKDKGEENSKNDTKNHIFLLTVADKYKLEVNHADVQEYVKQLALETGQEFNKVLEQVYKSDMLNEIRERILAGKALDLIFEQAQKVPSANTENSVSE